MKTMILPILILTIVFMGCAASTHVADSQESRTPLMYWGEGELVGACGGTCSIKVVFNEISYNKRRNQLTMSGRVSDKYTSEIYRGSYGVEILIGRRVFAEGTAHDGIIPLGARILVDQKFPIDEQGQFNFTARLKHSDRMYVAAISCLIEEYTLNDLLLITSK